MTTSKPTIFEFTEEQKQVALEVFDRWKSSGVWSACIDIDILFRSKGIQIKKVFKDIPWDIISINDNNIKVSIWGMALLEEASNLIDLYMLLLNRFLDSFIASPHAATHISKSEIDGIIKEACPAFKLDAIFNLINDNLNFYQSSMDEGNGTVVYSINPHIIKYYKALSVWDVWKSNHQTPRMDFLGAISHDHLIILNHLYSSWATTDNFPDAIDFMLAEREQPDFYFNISELRRGGYIDDWNRGDPKCLKLSLYGLSKVASINVNAKKDIELIILIIKAIGDHYGNPSNKENITCQDIAGIISQSLNKVLRVGNLVASTWWLYLGIQSGGDGWWAERNVSIIDIKDIQKIDDLLSLHPHLQSKQEDAKCLQILSSSELSCAPPTSDQSYGAGIEWILTTLRRFDVSARNLKDRPREAKKELGYFINDEYDTQDLLYVILKPLCDDLEREDPVPKTAGDSGRVDLSSRRFGTIIEIKYVKDSTRAHSLASECKERILTYYRWPELKYLVFFIYDPGRYIEDPDNIIGGLSIPNCSMGGKTFTVITIISPWQAGMISSTSAKVVTSAEFSMPPELPEAKPDPQTKEVEDKLLIALGQAAYIRTREAVIIPATFSNRSDRPNSIERVVLRIEGKDYEPCTPPPGLGVRGWNLYQSSEVRIDSWGTSRGVWMFGQGVFSGTPIVLSGNATGELHVKPVRGEYISSTITIIPLSEAERK